MWLRPSKIQWLLLRTCIVCLVLREVTAPRLCKRVVWSRSATKPGRFPRGPSPTPGTTARTTLSRTPPTKTATGLKVPIYPRHHPSLTPSSRVWSTSQQNPQAKRTSSTTEEESSEDNNETYWWPWPVLWVLRSKDNEGTNPLVD